MTTIQRIIVCCAEVAAYATVLFPPIVVLDGTVTAHTRYRFILSLSGLDSATFLWPVTVGFIMLELLLVGLLAGTLYFLAGRFAPRQRSRRAIKSPETNPPEAEELRG